MTWHIPWPLLILNPFPRHERDKAVIQCEQLQEQLAEARERPHSRLPSQEPGNEENMAEGTGEAPVGTGLPAASVKRKLSGDDVCNFLSLDVFLWKRLN